MPFFKHVRAHRHAPHHALAYTDTGNVAAQSYIVEPAPFLASQGMPNSKPAPLEDPGKRTGEGVESLLPHLHRQTQSQLKAPIRKRSDDAEGPETRPPEQ